MASKFYGKLLPDYTDLDNATGTASGYQVYIVENDGGIGLKVLPADAGVFITAEAGVFMNVSEARAMHESLGEAIVRAASKAANHKNRSRDC